MNLRRHSHPSLSLRSIPAWLGIFCHPNPVAFLGLAVVAVASGFLTSVGRSQLLYETPYFFTTLAGSLISGTNDGPGSAARFVNPAGVAADAGGNIYVVDVNVHLIRKISPRGVVTTLAGSFNGFVDGTGSTAKFKFPYGIAVDGSGNVFVADTDNHAIRKVTPSGVVTTVAGGLLGSLDETGSVARFNFPHGIAVDASGTIYVGDSGNHTIRKVTPNGVVTTLAGQPGVSGFADGNGSTARFFDPRGLAVDGSGNIFAADRLNNAIRKITPGGTVTTLAGGIIGSVDGPLGTARFATPEGIAIDRNGTSYVVEVSGFGRVRKITPSGIVTTLAGGVASGSADGTGSAARFLTPYGIAVDGAGKLYIADSGNFMIRMGVFPPPLPNFTTQPDGQSVNPGGSAIITSNVTSEYPISYQWQKDGAAIAGATTSTLDLANVQPASLGSYRVVATNLAGSTTSNIATLSFALNTAGRLTNLSIRSNAGTGGETLIVGLVVGGVGTSGSKPLLIRGAGPALRGFGVPEFLIDPTLSVFSGTNIVASNDNWSGDLQVIAIGGQVGAFPFGTTASSDAALYTTLNPTAYTVQISGVGGTTGVALAEIYDGTPSNNFYNTTPRLINVSARTQVGIGGDILIAGFAVGGTAPKTLLVRAIGPTLGVFGVVGALADPKLELFSSSAVLLQTNDNWGGGASIANAATRVGAFALDAASKDAVLLLTLLPGSYTAQISGVGNTTGVALVEIYDVP